jgi:hypothetical protein
MRVRLIKVMKDGLAALMLFPYTVAVVIVQSCGQVGCPQQDSTFSVLIARMRVWITSGLPTILQYAKGKYSPR